MGMAKKQDAKEIVSVLVYLDRNVKFLWIEDFYIAMGTILW